MIDIELVKRHLNVDESFVDDDELMSMYIENATAQLKADTGCSDTELREMLPIARQAILLLVGDYYAFREDTYNGTLTEQPKGYRRLVNILRHYD